MDTLTCAMCDREYVYDLRRGHTRNRCNSCTANAKHRFFKANVVAALGGKCVRCGYDKCHGALHAHHKDPAKKRFAISAARSRRWSDVQKELESCELVCANCHAEEHFTDKWRETSGGARPRLPQRRMVRRPGADHLRILVATTPMTQIAAYYKVSDNAVRKWCRAHGIACATGRGFWTGKSKPVRGIGSQRSRDASSAG